ncbi:MAG: hypothetical protein A4E73_00266 [Syntrophaceae bacterium PtaU1.Bin231]|nr:MAG: hypothetical protein A4E73_00266 [Syntrophaceae bacterium PtaU1.Bin231]
MTVLQPERPGIAVKPLEGFVTNPAHPLDAADVVCHGPHDARVVDTSQAFHHSREPPFGDDGVVVEQDHVLARGRLDSLVAAFCEPVIAAVLDEPAVLMFLDKLPEPADRPVGRSVVDEDNLVGLGCVPQDAFDTPLRVLQFIEGEDDDGDPVVPAVDFTENGSQTLLDRPGGPLTFNCSLPVCRKPIPQRGIVVQTDRFRGELLRLVGDEGVMPVYEPHPLGADGCGHDGKTP